MTTLIDGKATAAATKQEISDEVQQRVAQGLRRPPLAAVLVGPDVASTTYVPHTIPA